MVSRGRVVFALLGVVLLPVTGWAAEPAFKASVRSPEVEYGKRIDLELNTTLAEPSLNTVDLAPLEEDFVVETPDNVYDPEGADRQRWRIRLYPRRPGDASIPALFFRGLRTEPIAVRATAARDGTDGARIRVNSRRGASEVWVKQAVRVDMEIETGSPHAWLETDPASASGLDIVALPRSREAVGPAGASRTRHRLSWVLTPLASGRLDVQLPPVRYRRDGVTTHRFHPPRLSLQVRELPPYVPPSMPVGRLELDVGLPERLFLVKRELGFLSLRVRGASAAAQSHSDLLRQLESNEDISFYAARRAGAEAHQTGDRHEQIYEVPFVPNTMGLIDFPALRLQYFDPESGRIETRLHPLGRRVALSPWAVYLGAAILTLGVLGLARSVYRALLRQWRFHRAYRNALSKLERAEGQEDIKSALRDAATAEGWPVNLTLSAWRRRWLSRHPRLASVGEGVSRLQAWRYGRVETRLDAVRAPLQAGFYGRVPLLRLFDTLRGRPERRRADTPWPS